jgi:signal transduction histidine kinase
VALDRAVSRALAFGGPAPARVAIDSTETDDATSDVYSQALEEVTDRLVHELEPLLGAVTVHAEREVPKFMTSRTRTSITRLQSMLQAIEVLGQTAAAPAIREFDLSALVVQSSASAQAGSIRIELAGPSQQIVASDPNLVTVILENALRNAIEASQPGDDFDGADNITISWGETDIDYWLVVLDSGRGLPTETRSVFEIGTTNKRGHLGMGLALARQASQTLQGKVKLESRGRGCAFEFRWPKPRS